MLASRCIAALSLAVSLLAAGRASAAPEPTTLPAIITAVQATYSGVTAIRSDFQQTVKNAVTGVEEKQRGRLLLERPRKMRLELGLPLKSAVVSDGTTQWVYAADAKQVIVQKLLGTGSGVEKLIDDLGNLSELFDVTLVPPSIPPRPVHQLTLKPKVAGGVRQLNLTIKRSTFLLQDLDVVDAIGGVVKMSFSGMILGGDIPDAVFSFKPPPGVTVVQM